MYVPEKLKLNKYEAVKIPSNKDYFARLGEQQLGDNAYTGDQPVEMAGRKIDEIIAGEFAAEREMRDSESKDSKSKDS